MAGAIRIFKNASELLDLTGQTGIVILASGTPSFLGSTGSGNVARPAGSLVITTGKTFTASNTLTLAGTDGSTLNIGTGANLTTLAAGTGTINSSLAFNFDTGSCSTFVATTIQANGGFYIGGSTIVWKSASGSPESAITGAVGSIFSRTDGAAGTALYVKQSGSGNTGWSALGTAAFTASSAYLAPNGSGASLTGILASQVGFTQTGTGATARTVDALLREDALSVKDFGAAGDGSTDDTAAVQLALTALEASSTKSSLYFPPGRYRLTTITASPATGYGNGALLRLGVATDLTGRRIKIFGDGAKLYSDVGATQTIMLFCKASFRALDVEGLTFEKSSTVIPDSEWTDAILVQPYDGRTVDYVRTTNCTFVNCHRAASVGILSDSTQFGLLKEWTMENCSLLYPYAANATNAAANGGGQGVIVFPWVGTFTASNNYFDGASSGALDVGTAPGKALKDGFVFGCALRNVITGNTVLRFGVEGIFVTGEKTMYLGATTTGFTVPAADNTTTVTATLSDATNLVATDSIYIQNAGYFNVTAWDSGTKVVTFKNPGGTHNQAPTTVIASGKTVYLPSMAKPSATITGNLVDGTTPTGNTVGTQTGPGSPGVAITDTQGVISSNRVVGCTSGIVIYSKTAPADDRSLGAAIIANHVEMVTAPAAVYPSGIGTYSDNSLISSNVIITPLSVRTLCLTLRASKARVFGNLIRATTAQVNGYGSVDRAVGISIFSGITGTLLADNTTENFDIGVGGESGSQTDVYTVLSHSTVGDVLGLDTHGGNAVLPTGTGSAVLGTSPTITTATLTNPKIATIKDANGNTMLATTVIGSAVNALDITNAATTGRVLVGVSGSDTNIGMDIKSKGTGSVRVLSNGVTSATFEQTVARIEGSLVINNGGAGTYALYNGFGSGTNIDLSVADTWMFKTGDSERLRINSAGIVVTGALTTTGGIEIGHASDTTLTRVSAGVIAVEGVTILTTAAVDDTAYDATSWDGDTTHAPSKNAVRDKIEALGAGGGAPTDATYIVQTANGSLSAEQALGALATGILKNTTTTGVLSIAAAGTDYLAPGAIGVTVQAYDTDLAAWAGKTAPSGTVLGTSDTQTITGTKSFEVGNLSLAGATSGSITLNATAIAGSNVVLLPAATGTALLRDDTATITNKSIVASQLTGIIDDARMPNFTGDFTTVEGAVAATLATVNGNVGSFINASVTVNAKGLVTAASSTSGSVAQIVSATYATYSSTTATIPADDTLPQNTEGTEIFTCSITPKNASSTLIIEVFFPVLTTSGALQIMAALFKDAGADAIAVNRAHGTAAVTMTSRLLHKISAGSTSAQTFKAHIGVSSGTAYINGNSSARLFGGASIATMTITEILP